MNNRWMLGIAMMLGSAVICAQSSSTTPQILYDTTIIVAVNGVETSTVRMVGFPGVPYHVFAFLGPDANKSPRMRIDATATETQQASAGSAIVIKLTLSKPDSKGDMQMFATPVVVGAEGQISYVQVGDITLSVWVMRTHTPSATDRAAADRSRPSWPSGSRPSRQCFFGGYALDALLPWKVSGMLIQPLGAAA